MTNNIIWWLAIALEAGLLLRAAISSRLRSYPLFYGYIGCVLTIELLRFVCYRLDPGFYQNFYWYSEFITILASYGVILEIYKRSFKNHPGVSRLAQSLLIVALFITVVSVASNIWVAGFRSWARGVADLGCALRYVEGGLLVVILFLLGIYRISSGWNLRGLIAGYGFLVGMDVMNLALLFHPGNEFSLLLRRLLPVTYVVTLLIWFVTLWALHLDPSQPAEDEIERDYQVVAARTRAILTRVSTQIVRAIRT